MRAGLTADEAVMEYRTSGCNRMSWQYIYKAVGTYRWRFADWVEPCDEHGNILPYLGDDDMFMRYATLKVKDFEVKDRVMYCRLEGVKIC